VASFDTGDISLLGSSTDTGAGTSVTVYTVPSGQKALILEIRSDNRTSTTHTIALAPGGDSITLATGANLLSFQGKVVLAATEVFFITKAANDDVRSAVIGIEVLA